ncbi:MAG: hypothetical protein R2726_20350 [Acidimicrobiales bacterium]
MVEPSSTPEPTATRRTPLVVALVVVSVIAVAAIVAVVVLARRDTGSTITAAPSTTTEAPTGTTAATAPATEPSTATSSTVTSSSAASTASTSTASTSTTVHPSGIDRNGLGVQGLAPIRLGMTRAEAAAATGLTPEPAKCGNGVIFLVDGEQVYVGFDGNERVAAIHVKSSNISTLSGIRVGDPRDRVVQTYAGHGTLTPMASPYANAELLVYRSGDPADADHEVVFWVTDGTVSSIVAATGTAGESELC